MKLILVTREIPQSGITTLLQKGYVVDVNPDIDPPSQKKLIKLLSKKPYDAVITHLTDKIDAKVFDACPTAKLFANYATGFDNFDLEEAKKRGITITNAPTDSSAEAVAEHTIALMLALAGRVVEADKFTRKGKYHGWSPSNFVGINLFGKTLGLIGAGRIGSKVMQYAKGLNMRIIYTDQHHTDDFEQTIGAKYYATPEEILEHADIVSLHVPLFESTRHLINEVRLKHMKPSAFLINTSRGPVVDENALLQALKNKVIAGAALDVFEFEPHLAKGLTKLNNVILTPHIASASIEARTDMATVTTTNVVDYLEGKSPSNRIV